MSILARFNTTNLTSERYDEANRRLEEAGLWPDPDGLEYHVCFGSEDNMRVSEIRNSRAQLDAYGARLMPILADAGIEFSEDPEIFEVHDTSSADRLARIRKWKGRVAPVPSYRTSRETV